MKQKIAIAAAVVIALMILFPPWVVGKYRLGYSPIFSEAPVYPPPEEAAYSRKHGTVDTPLLLGQIVVALGAAGLAMFAFRKE